MQCQRDYSKQEERMFDEKAFKAFQQMALQMIYGEKSAKDVHGMLSSGPLDKSLPETAKSVTSMAAKAFKQNGQRLEPEVFIAGTLAVGKELVDVAEAAGMLEDAEDAMPLVEAASKASLHQGMKEKAVDPVALQKVLNEGMPDGMQKGGMDYAEKRGVPLEANDGPVAMEQYALQRMEEMHNGV
jgi:hypothetical protein